MRYIPKYLQTINDKIQNDHLMMNQFYSYLMDIDIECNKLPEIPMTEIKNILIALNMTSVEMFFLDEYKRCIDFDYNRTNYTIKELYNKYLSWYSPDKGALIIESTFIKHCNPFIEFTTRTKTSRLYRIVKHE